MADARTNVQTFRGHVEEYFDDVKGIIFINLTYLPDYTAKVVAINEARDTFSKDLSVDRHELREMLTGTIRELNIIHVRWTNITVSIRNTGAVEVIVNW